MNAADPFGLDEPDRDQWKRPLIRPPGGGKPEPYTRASTFAKALSDGGGLSIWKTRHAAVGVARRPDLAVMLAALDPEPKKTADKRALDAIVERAHEASGGNVKADHGTAVHSFTEAANPFGDFMPDAIRPDVDSYTAELKRWGITEVEAETFVIDDLYRVAGTRDAIVTVPPNLARWLSSWSGSDDPSLNVALDKKTGRLDFLEHSIQLAIYARGQKYADDTGERIDVEGGVRTDVAIVAHIPRLEGRTDLYVVDIARGYWHGCRLAREVMQWRKGEKAAGALFAEGWTAERDPVDEATLILTAAERASTTGELLDLYRRASRCDVEGAERTHLTERLDLRLRAIRTNG